MKPSTTTISLSPDALKILRVLVEHSDMPWLMDTEVAELTGLTDLQVRQEIARFPRHWMPLTATVFQDGMRPKYHIHDAGRAFIQSIDGGKE